MNAYEQTREALMSITKKFQAWQVPWFASGIGMVYSTDFIPLWIAFFGVNVVCFAFVIFYAVKLEIRRKKETDKGEEADGNEYVRVKGNKPKLVKPYEE